MKHTFGKQAKQAGIALAAVAAFAALGIIGTTSADPQTGTPTFASAKFSIEAGQGGSETAPPAGGLTCAWRETGLQSFQLVIYNCDAEVVGALEGCVIKGKLQGGSPLQLSVFQHPLVVLGGEATGFVANNKGMINASETTPVPVSGTATGGGELCTEPAEAQVVAVRWCNASLVDTANNLVGSTAVELFEESYAGVGAGVPSCEVLATMPPTPTPH